MNRAQDILYGSYARGDNRSDSDMDVMILTTKSSEERGACSCRTIEN